MRHARYAPPLPEALPDSDCWHRLLWPWLDRIDEVRPGCAVVARSLAYAVDGRDETVDTERVRVGTPHDHRLAVAELVDHGFLESRGNGRHRVVLPPSPARSSRTRVSR